MKLSDYVFDFVTRLGVKHVFMVSGGGAMHLNDSLGLNTALIHVSNLHEQASAIAAEAYSKATENLGVALVTTGPGGTNAVTGVAGAWLDSTPCLFLSGQVKRPDLKGDSGVRQMGVQEVDIVSVVKSLTKYAVTITDPGSIRYHLEKAVFLAKNGRPGPVWIDIPLDVQAATLNVDELEGFEPPAPEETEKSLVDQAVRETIALLNTAERPVLLIGNGVRLSRAEAELHEMRQILGLPTMATWLAVDLFSYDDETYLGKPGTVAPRGTNFALQNSDFMLSIGARIDNTTTGYAPEKFARGAKKIMVDIDPSELKKVEHCFDLFIHADARVFMRSLLEHRDLIVPRDRSDWMSRCRDWKSKYPVVLPEHRMPNQKVSTYYFAEILSEELSEGALIASGSSGAGIEIFQHALRMKKGQRLFHTAALGAMGFCLPTAIGACLGSGRRETVAVDGDGGFQFNIQELETIRRLNLPVKIFVLNNAGYSSIRASQQRWFERLTGADATSGVTLPDITKVAAAYDLPTARIATQNNLREEIRAVLQTSGPMVCDVVCIPDELRVPSLSSVQRKDGSMVSRPMEDLWPFLSREELQENMLIPVIPDE